MEKRKVSIVCRCYNHEKTIQEAINSVINQTYNNWELIIVDDCSTDNSEQIINSFKDKRIKFYKNKNNLGAIGNLNKGLSLCNGDYISILDGDDKYLPEKLIKQVKFLDENPDYGACFSYIRIENHPDTQNIKEIYYKLLNQPSGTRAQMLKKMFFKENFLAFPTEMFRKEYIIDFPENLIATGDYNFHVNMLLKTKIKVLEEQLVDYNVNNPKEHLSSLTTSISNQIELSQLYETFLKITDVDLFKEIFKGHWETFGEPTQKTLPYFIARVTISDTRLCHIGLHLLSKIFAEKGYLKYILENTNMSYGDYLRIRMGKKSKKNSKMKRYRILFQSFLILSIIMLILNFILIFKRLIS